MSEVTNQAVIDAINDDPAAVREALELLKKAITDINTIDELDDADSWIVRDASEGLDRRATIAQILQQVVRSDSFKSLEHGLISNRPAASTAGADAWFLSTDEPVLYRSTGSEWEAVLDGTTSKTSTAPTLVFATAGTENNDGAAGDGSTDDAAALQALIDEVESAGGGVIDGERKTYRIDTTFEMKSNVHLRGFTFDFSNSAELSLVTVSGNEGSDISVSGTIHQQSLSFDVSDTSSISALDYVKVLSDDYWSTTTSAGNIQSGEIIRIRSVDSGTSLTMFSFAHQDYVDTDNAVIRKQNYVENIVVEDCKVIGSGGTSNITAFNIEWGRNIHFRRVEVENIETRAFDFERCLQCSVRDCTANVDGGSAMYGVAASQGSEHITVEGCDFYRTRHGFSTGGTEGVNRYLTVRNNRVIGATNAGLDAHPATDLCIYEGNYVEVEGSDGTNEGIIYQGSRATIRGNHIVGKLRIGIFCQAKVASVTDGEPNWYIVTDNAIIGEEMQDGIQIATEETREMSGSVVSNNRFFGVDFTRYGIYVKASAAQIDRMTITGNVVQNCDDFALYIDSNGNSIQQITVNGNVLSREADQLEDVVRMQADASNGIRRVVFTGNTLVNGDNAIAGTDEEDILAIGNNATNVNSFNGLSATNTTVTNNLLS